MFERRLKIFLVILLLISGALALRAGQLQLVRHDEFVEQAASHMQHTEYTQTSRGTIVDRTGQVLAIDEPCVDAAVDYAAILEVPDPAYVKNRAWQNLSASLGKTWWRGSDAAALLEAESNRVRQTIADMWTELAKDSDQSPDEIDDTRKQIVAKVEIQRRSIDWREVTRLSKTNATQNWYRRILDDSANATNDDRLAITRDSYVVLHNLKPQTQVAIAQYKERFFALKLVPGKFRNYPYGRVACHVIGYLGQVGDDQIGKEKDPFYADPLKRYAPGELAGKSGLEALCEGQLRGFRGTIEHIATADQPDVPNPAIPGKDIQTTLDIGLQADVEALVEKERIYHTKDGDDVRADQHCAAVVIQIKTGDVLAMVSNPGFDLNTVQENLVALLHDDINTPMLNRATQMIEEPGSTVKPIVGAGAITDHIWSATDTVQCKGELVIDGKPQAYGHCWTYALFKSGSIERASHNLAPGYEQLPDDRLTVSDGLERSCNVCFETIADKMGLFELAHWLDQFGLGRSTGIGIEENPGRIPHVSQSDHSPALRPMSWRVGIGEGEVAASPLQMANEAATIARRGIWMRPRLVDAKDMLRATTRPAPTLPPDSVDLHISDEAIQADQIGMYRVVNAPDATGYQIRPDEQNPPTRDDPLSLIHIAGKTGTLRCPGPSAISDHSHRIPRHREMVQNLRRKF